MIGIPLKCYHSDFFCLLTTRQNGQRVLVDSFLFAWDCINWV